MSHLQLPREPDEVLAIPAADIPDTLRALIERRKLSRLMARIHCELRSPDRVLRHHSRAALLHLGFPE